MTLQKKKSKQKVAMFIGLAPQTLTVHLGGTSLAGRGSRAVPMRGLSWLPECQADRPHLISTPRTADASSLSHRVPWRGLPTRAREIQRVSRPVDQSFYRAMDSSRSDKASPVARNQTAPRQVEANDE